MSTIYKNFLYLGTDHAGFELKEQIKKYLLEQGFEVKDCGAHEYNKDDDYPDFIGKAAEEVAKNPENSRGIVLGKSGAGECIVANKIKGIRAFLAISENNVKLAREHNNANVISLGSDFVNLERAKQLIDIFLKTPFSNEERHIRRIEKIKKIEDEQ